jgi:hypothetical protein
MADLKTLADSLNVQINHERNQAQGKKRRAWLPDNTNTSKKDLDLNRVYKPINKIGPINPVDQPYLNGSINPVDQPILKNRVDQSISASIINLRGNPLKLILHLFDLSNDNSLTITPKITRSQIQKDLKISIDSVKTALRFLLKNKFIDIVFSLKGKTGYSQYKLKEAVFYEIKSG